LAFIFAILNHLIGIIYLSTIKNITSGGEPPTTHYIIHDGYYFVTVSFDVLSGVAGVAGL
jgi:hypothetical protein